MVPSPTATHIIPFHATPFPAREKIDVPNPVQVVPLLEYAILFVPPPTATVLFVGNMIVFGRAELYATPYPVKEKKDVDPETPLQVIPSREYATVLVP